MNRVVTYQGQTYYGLIEQRESNQKYCIGCAFAPINRDKCQAFKNAANNGYCSPDDTDLIWQSGAEAQAQYILERLTS